MHIYDEQKACDYACMCMWLCTSMLCSQLVTMYARAWVSQLYATQSSCDYACLCMWLCTSMSCSQLVTSHAWACGYACMYMWLCTATARSQTITLQELELCKFMPCSKFVTMHACGCDYAHLCHVVRFNSACMSMRLCMHVHVIMCTYAMQSACNLACMCIYAHFWYAVSL